MSFASVENYWLVFCGYYHGELLDRSHGGLLSSGNCWCLQFLGRSVSTLSPIPMTPGVAGGRKLEAERQGAERQDEERATGAERPDAAGGGCDEAGMEDTTREVELAPVPCS